MADLSSCYFCGGAMDVSLREHPIVPAAFSPASGRQTTVVLCGTCERKLERVLDPVVDAAPAPQRATADGASPGDAQREGGAGTASGAAAVEDATNADDDSAANLPPGALSGVDDAEREAEDDGETAAPSDDASSERDDETPFEVDETTSVFDDDADETGSDSVFTNETDAPTTTIPDAEADHDGSDGIAFDDQSTGRTPDESETASDQRRERTDATDSDAAKATDAAPTGGGGSNADTGTDSGTDTPDVDPQTYNKVVRLLKNRDLPVARTEIESIAGSAYEIPDHECKAIIDTAIQRGLVAENGSELTHPDGV
jgi:hypothetical protein